MSLFHMLRKNLEHRRIYICRLQLISRSPSGYPGDDTLPKINTLVYGLHRLY